MVIALLIVTFVIALGVASIVAVAFKRPVDSILARIVPPEICQAWARYLRFAIYVVGIGGGVRVWSFEKYLVAQEPYGAVVPLTANRWVLEVYETVIGALQSTAMVLLVFFVFALIAVVIVRVFESRAAKEERR